MAKRSHRGEYGESVNFTIEAPISNTTVTTTSMGTITVRMDDNGSVHGFAARIYEFSNLVGLGNIPVSGPIDFPIYNPMSTKRYLSISVGTINTTVFGNNRVIQVEDKIDGTLVGHPFRAVAGSGSGSPPVLTVCEPGELVPAALTLKLGSKVTKGTCSQCAALNRPTPLLHSDEAKAKGCWYSQPILLGGKNAPPAYWVLERRNATTWMLVLKQGETVLVTFVAKTKPKDLCVPTKLQRKGAGSKACKDWPKTVSITPVK